RAFASTTDLLRPARTRQPDAVRERAHVPAVRVVWPRIARLGTDRSATEGPGAGKYPSFKRDASAVCPRAPHRVANFDRKFEHNAPGPSHLDVPVRLRGPSAVDLSRSGR